MYVHVHVYNNEFAFANVFAFITYIFAYILAKSENLIEWFSWETFYKAKGSLKGLIGKARKRNNKTNKTNKQTNK